MKTWHRARSALRSAQAASLSEPKYLAPVLPLLEDALALFENPPTRSSVDEAIYLVTKVQDFVAKWRPRKERTPGVFYVQPQWARSVDDQAGDALLLLKEVSDSELQVEGLPLQAPNQLTGQFTSTMRVFISHSSRDAVIAENLVDFLRSSFRLSANDIRCTSVDGYKLPAGANIDAQLRAEVFESDVFVALLSPASLTSAYVLFELGARWGTNRYIAPIAVGGANPGEFRSPLSAMHCINGTHEPDVLQLLEDLAKHLKLSTERASSYSKALKTFLASAQQ